MSSPRWRIDMAPRLRATELVPLESNESPRFGLRDPQGYADTVVLSDAAAMLAMLMNGRRTLEEIRAAYEGEAGQAVAPADLQHLVHQLDEAHLLAGPRFERHRRRSDAAYLTATVRPAAHAGGAYAADPALLRDELAEYFTCEEGPGAIRPRRRGSRARAVCGVLSPHIDPYRGGPGYAWAYKQIAERTEARRFIIFGTAHQPTSARFAISRKDFETPLGRVSTDRTWIDGLAKLLRASPAGRQVELFADEMAHRQEHSIEFQAMFLQAVLGPHRPFTIVPILVGSLYDHVRAGTRPASDRRSEAFVAAVRKAIEGCAEPVCCIAGADLAHIGPRFGDPEALAEETLEAQARDDHRLLRHAARGQAEAFFGHVAQSGDRSRICGVAPIYAMLRILAPCRGRLLHYDQAVEPEGAACVSFATMAFSQ